MKSINTIAQAYLINFNSYHKVHSTLTVYESITHVPFSIGRIFTIHTHEAVERGHHAHKECAQMLVCLGGKCEVTIDDGQARRTYTLAEPHKGLLIPPTLWAEQKYETQTILMVLADQPYDEKDYIRDYEQFLEFRNTII